MIFPPFLLQKQRPAYRNKHKFVLGFLVIVFLVLSVDWAYALEVPQLKYLPGFENIDKIGSLAELVMAVYRFALGIVGLIAFVIFIIAGVQYLISPGNPQLQAKARGRIGSALLGTALLLGAFVILNTVNPALTVFNIQQQLIPQFNVTLCAPEFDRDKPGDECQNFSTNKKSFKDAKDVETAITPRSITNPTNLRVDFYSDKDFKSLCGTLYDSFQSIPKWGDKANNAEFYDCSIVQSMKISNESGVILYADKNFQGTSTLLQKNVRNIVGGVKTSDYSVRTFGNQEMRFYTEPFFGGNECARILASHKKISPIEDPKPLSEETYTCPAGASVKSVLLRSTTEQKGLVTLYDGEGFSGKSLEIYGDTTTIPSVKVKSFMVRPDVLANKTKNVIAFFGGENFYGQCVILAGTDPADFKTTAAIGAKTTPDPKTGKSHHEELAFPVKSVMLFQAAISSQKDESPHLNEAATLYDGIGFNPQEPYKHLPLPKNSSSEIYVLDKTSPVVDKFSMGGMQETYLHFVPTYQDDQDKTLHTSGKSDKERLSDNHDPTFEDKNSTNKQDGGELTGCVLSSPHCKVDDSKVKRVNSVDQDWLNKTASVRLAPNIRAFLFDQKSFGSTCEGLVNVDNGQIRLQDKGEMIQIFHITE